MDIYLVLYFLLRVTYLVENILKHRMKQALSFSKSYLIQNKKTLVCPAQGTPESQSGEDTLPRVRYCGVCLEPRRNQMNGGGEKEQFNSNGTSRRENILIDQDLSLQAARSKKQMVKGRHTSR